MRVLAFSIYFTLLALFATMAMRAATNPQPMRFPPMDISSIDKE